MPLVLHTGGVEISVPNLGKIMTPEHTETWYPIPHIDILNFTLHSLDELGFKVDNQNHGINKDGNEYFGLLEVSASDNSFVPTDFTTVIGLRNSHNKMLAAGFVFGSGVFVCDNLAFSGETRIMRKHTINAAKLIPSFIRKALHGIIAHIEDQNDRYEKYKEFYISDKDADHYIVQMIKANCLNAHTILSTISEWYSPSYIEFSEKKNIWRLFNAATQALKSNPKALPDRTIMLTSYLDSIVYE